MKKIGRKISRTPAYRRVVIELRRRKLRNTDVSFLTVLDIFFKKLKKDDLDQRANGVAFNFTLSIFPALIFFFTLIPFVPIHDLDGKIINFMAQVLPQGIWEDSLPTIHDIVSRPRGRLLSFGFIFTIFASSNGMVVLMEAFNRCYKTRESRSFVKKRLVAIGLTLLLGLVLLFAVVFLIVGQYIGDYLRIQGVFNDVMSMAFGLFLRYFVVFLIFFLGVSSIYFIAPAVNVRWKFISTGSITSSLLCIVVTQLFSYYLVNFSTYNRLYGSIGTFIGLMLWFYLLSFILLIGFEINASIDEAKSRSMLQKIK